MLLVSLSFLAYQWLLCWVIGMKAWARQDKLVYVYVHVFFEQEAHCWNASGCRFSWAQKRQHAAFFPGKFIYMQLCTMIFQVVTAIKPHRGFRSEWKLKKGLWLIPTSFFLYIYMQATRWYFCSWIWQRSSGWCSPSSLSLQFPSSTNNETVKASCMHIEV